MVRNAGPPNLQLSTVDWTLSSYLAERSPVPMPSLARAGVDALQHRNTHQMLQDAYLLQERDWPTMGI
jgi:hypothetical protein